MRLTRFIVVTGLVGTAIAACNKDDDKKKDECKDAACETDDGGQGADGTGFTPLTVGTPVHLHGHAGTSDHLAPPFQAELTQLFTFSVDQTAKLQAVVSGLSWGDGCGSVDGPWIAYGVSGSRSMEVLPEGDPHFPADLTPGKYDIMVNLVTEAPCDLKDGVLAVQAD